MNITQALEQLNSLEKGAVNSVEAGMIIIKISDGSLYRLDLENDHVSIFSGPSEQDLRNDDWGVVKKESALQDLDRIARSKQQIELAMQTKDKLFGGAPCTNAPPASAS